jgi:hypothetical protein
MHASVAPAENNILPEEICSAVSHFCREVELVELAELRRHEQRSCSPCLSGVMMLAWAR